MSVSFSPSCSTRTGRRGNTRITYQSNHRKCRLRPAAFSSRPRQNLLYGQQRFKFSSSRRSEFDNRSRVFRLFLNRSTCHWARTVVPALLLCAGFSEGRSARALAAHERRAIRQTKHSGTSQRLMLRMFKRITGRSNRPRERACMADWWRLEVQTSQEFPWPCKLWR